MPSTENTKIGIIEKKEYCVMGRRAKRTRFSLLHFVLSARFTLMYFLIVLFYPIFNLVLQFNQVSSEVLSRGYFKEIL